MESFLCVFSFLKLWTLVTFGLLSGQVWAYGYLNRCKRGIPNQNVGVVSESGIRPEWLLTDTIASTPKASAEIN